MSKILEIVVPICLIIGYVLYFMWSNNIEADPIKTLIEVNGKKKLLRPCLKFKIEMKFQSSIVDSLMLSTNEDLRVLAGKCVKSIEEEMIDNLLTNTGGQDNLIVIFFGTITDKVSDDEFMILFGTGMNKDLFIDTGESWSTQDSGTYNKCHSIFTSISKKLPVSELDLNFCSHDILRRLLYEQTGFNKVFFK